MSRNQRRNWKSMNRKWSPQQPQDGEYEEYGTSPPINCFNKSRLHSVLKRNQPGGESSSGGPGVGARMPHVVGPMSLIRRTITNGIERLADFKQSGRRREDGRIIQSWSKVKVINGIAIGKDYVINSLNDYLDTGIPIKPVSLQFSPDEGSFVFYLEDKEVAEAVKSASRRITAPGGQNIIFNVYPNPPPFPLITPTQEDIIKSVLNGRYDPATYHLNLSDFVNDAEFKQRNIYDLPLNRSAVMYVVVKLIVAYCPQVKSIDVSRNKLKFLDSLAVLSYCDLPITRLVLSNNLIEHKRELEKLDRFQLTELDIDGNNICAVYQDADVYIKMARSIFPKLVKLDNTDIGVPITFTDINNEKDVGKDSKLPLFKGSHFGCEANQTILTKFVTEYFGVYDSGDRSALLNAYDSDAVMTMSASFVDQQANTCRPSTWSNYVREGHNIKFIDMWERNRKRLFRRGKLAIAAFLQELPKTKHDLSTFILDVSFCTTEMLCFVVSGLFVDGTNCDKADYDGPMLHFTRTFLVVSTPGGISVINEELFMCPFTVEQCKMHRSLVQKSFLVDQVGTVPSTSAVVPIPQQITSETKREMIAKFSTESGMFPAWAERCLDQNQFDYNKSAQVFMNLKSSGGIPPEAFMPPAT